MQSNTIYMSTLQSKYRTALVFSIIEGLKQGQSLNVISESEPVDLEALIINSGISDVLFENTKTNDGSWSIQIQKKQDIDQSHVGCCGMCGGHKS